MMVRRLIVHCRRPLVLLAAIVSLAVVAQQCEEPRAEAAPPLQSSQTRTVDWYYWLDTGYPQIQRARLDGSGVAETVVISSEMSTTHDFALDPGGNYVYWADDGHNQIRRKSADGAGSVETLVNTGISSPYRIAVDYSYVYWADTGNDTIKRAQTYGSYTVNTLADSSDGVSNVAAIDVDGSYLYWADSGNDSVRVVETFGSNTVTTLVNTGLANPQDLEVGRNGSYVSVLDRNGANSTVKRVETFGGHTVTTLASNTGDTPMDDPVALTPGSRTTTSSTGWTRTTRRCAGWRPTARPAPSRPWPPPPGGAVTDLTLSPDGGGVYWLDNSSNRVKWIRTDGSGMVRDVITSGLSVPLRMRVDQDTETIAGSCITDAGTLDADYATHDWEADIDATCPSAFHTFRLAGAADLRITATSPSINPLPLLRKGGIGGEPVALTGAANGASTPYVYQAEAGQHTIELVREFNSANTAGGFAARLQTQPMLSGCDVNLGTLSSDQLQVFGAHDPDCGDTRKYFFYLEFPASVSASASGVGFTPNIEPASGIGVGLGHGHRPGLGQSGGLLPGGDLGIVPHQRGEHHRGRHLQRVPAGLRTAAAHPYADPQSHAAAADQRGRPHRAESPGLRLRVEPRPLRLLPGGRPRLLSRAGALHRLRSAHHRHLGGVAGLRRLHRGGAGRRGPGGVLPPPHLRPAPAAAPPCRSSASPTAPCWPPTPSASPAPWRPRRLPPRVRR